MEEERPIYYWKDNHIEMFWTLIVHTQHAKYRNQAREVK